MTRSGLPYSSRGSDLTENPTPCRIPGTQTSKTAGKSTQIEPALTKSAGSQANQRAPLGSKDRPEVAAARTGSGGSRPRACDLAAAPFPDQWRSNDGSRPGGMADDASAGRGGGGWREQPVRTCSSPHLYAAAAAAAVAAAEQDGESLWRIASPPSIDSWTLGMCAFRRLNV